MHKQMHSIPVQCFRAEQNWDKPPLAQSNGQWSWENVSLIRFILFVMYAQHLLMEEHRFLQKYIHSQNNKTRSKQDDVEINYIEMVAEIPHLLHFGKLSPRSERETDEE